MNEQLGFAFDLCRRAQAVPDPIFSTLVTETERMIHRKLLSVRRPVFCPSRKTFDPRSAFLKSLAAELGRSETK
jgi:hypothetical protein